jgi:hypothetical protein
MVGMAEMRQSLQLLRVGEVLVIILLVPAHVVKFVFMYRR